MIKNLLIQRIIIGLMFCNIIKISCNNETEKYKFHPKHDNDSVSRSKRGLVLFIPSNNSHETLPEINKNISEKHLDSIANPLFEKNKRDVAEPQKIFIHHYDMFDAHRHVNTAVDSLKKNKENRSKPYIRMKSVTDRKGIIKELVDARKRRQSNNENPITIVMGRKIHRPKWTKRKNYTCYCKKTKCSGRSCSQDEIVNQVNWKNDFEDNDYKDENVSGEVTDNPSIVDNYDINDHYKHKVPRMAIAEPTKFNIPFTNNVNFDQKVAIGRINNEKKKYRILPIYQSVPLKILKNPSHSNNKYNPHLTSQSADIYTGIKQKQRNRISVTDPNVPESKSYMDECIGIYGPEVCATLATAENDQIVLESNNMGIAMKKSIHKQKRNKIMEDDSEIINNNNNNQRNRQDMQENLYATTSVSRSVDERPSMASKNNSKESSNMLHNRLETEGNFKKHNTKEVVLQNAIKTVINNFVPGKAQDFLANYGTKKMPNSKINMEDLLPEILDSPIMKKLLSVPEVEDMIVDTSTKFLIQILDMPNHQLTQKSIKKSLHDIIDQIPHPHSTVAPIIPDDNNEWVTERMYSLENSNQGTTTEPPKEVFDKIERIINRSALGEQAVSQPVVQNLIIKTVKHSLDKEHGVIDEFTIRRAFDMLMQPKASITQRAMDRNVYYDYSTSSEPETVKLKNDEEKKSFISTIEPHSTQNDDDDSIENTSILDTTLTYVTSDVIKRNERFTPQTDQFNSGFTTIQSSNDNKINLLTDSIKTNRHDNLTNNEETNHEPSNFHTTAQNDLLCLLFLGKLLPENHDKRINIENLPDIKDLKCNDFGDDVKEPMNVMPLQHCTFVSTLSDEKCKEFANERCSCSLQNDDNQVVRKRRNGMIIPKLSFTDDKVVAVNEKLKKFGSKRSKKESEENVDNTTVIKNKRKKKSLLKNFVRNDVNKNKVDDKNDDDKSYKNIPIETLFHQQNDNSFISLLKQFQNQQKKSLDGPPYKYQKYTYEDENVKKRTNALKNIIYKIKNLLVNNSKK